LFPKKWACDESAAVELCGGAGLGMATITTVIPVYNGEKYLTETLQCLARQTRRPDRVIAVDDGSTDRTREIVENFSGIKCEWAPNGRNLGLFPNHNSALRFASETKFFHILHANDTISPAFFETLVPLIENASGYAMAFSGHVFVREDGTPTDQRGGIQGQKPRRLPLREFLEMQSELKSIQLHSVVLKMDFKKSPVEFHLDFPQLGDVVFHAKFATHCSEIWADPQILSQVRLHESAVTARNMMNMKAWVTDEWRAMQLIDELMRERNISRWAHREKLKLLFAARARVKGQVVHKSNPQYGRQIAQHARTTTSILHWAAAVAVVALRDALFPKADASKERLESK
jgi:glycosyltransferase involved in cell wall biosynthesis